VVDAAPTSRHAEALFDAVASQLGEQGRVESNAKGTWRWLFRRDTEKREWFVPWPLLELKLGSRIGIVTPWIETGTGVVAPPKPPPRHRAPGLRGLQAGDLCVSTGPENVEVVYGDDGGWLETCRTEQLGTLAALAVHQKGKGNRIEQLAERIKALDPGGQGPGRVRTVLRSGVAEAWLHGLGSLRAALFEGRVPSDARWVAADGWVGTAIGHGTTRPAALASWQRQVGIVRPQPWRPDPAPPAPPPDLGDQAGVLGVFTITSTPDDRPAPDPDLHQALSSPPLVLIPLPPLPEDPLPSGTWVRLAGRFGAIHHAVLLPDPEGITLLGEQVLPAPARLQALLDAAESRFTAQCAAAWSKVPRALPPPDCRVVTFRLHTADARVISASVESLVEGSGFRPQDLDGDVLVSRVLRMRRLRK
jgi:hypothetical protein